MAIHELQPKQYNRPIDSLVRGSTAEQLDLNPPYQRGTVWTLHQRRMLILSLLQGLPIGAVFINHRTWDTSYCVDGKQRIETLQFFYDDRFTVPGDWFDMEDEVTYSMLSPRDQRWFNNRTVATYETDFPTQESEEELYLRINYGGTPHEPLT